MGSAFVMDLVVRRKFRTGWLIAVGPVCLLAGSLSLPDQPPSIVCGAEAPKPPVAKEGGDPATDSDAVSSPAALQLFTDAANFQNNQAFDLAAEAWDKFLQRHSGDPRAAESRYNLGMSLLQLASQPGDDRSQVFTRAVDTLQLVTQGANPSLAADAWLNLGLANYTKALEETEPAARDQRLQASADALTRYLSDFPDAGRKDQALFYRGECLYLKQDTPGSAQSYQQLVEEYPGSALFADGLYAWGVVLEETRDFPCAEEVYQRFLESQPEHTLVPEVMARHAEMMLQQKKYVDAAQEFEKAAQQPNYPQADQTLFRAAYAWASADDFRQGGATFARLIDAFPQSALVSDATIAAARSYYRIPDIESARTWYQRAAALDGSPQAIVLANEAAHWLNRDELQRQQTDPVVQRAEARIPSAKPTDYLVHLRLDRADAWYQMPDRRNDAITEYEDIAREFPDHFLTARALYNAAYAYLEKGDYDRATEIANRPLPSKGNQPAPHLEAELRSVAAESALQLKQYERAEQSFADLRANGLEAYRPYWGVRQALSMHLRGQHEPAVQVLDVVSPTLTMSAHQAESLYVRGLCELALDRGLDAEQSLARSFERDGQWRQADEVLLALARVQRTTRGPAAARETLARIERDFPRSAILDESHLRWAEFAYAEKLYRESAEHYQKLLEQWPASTWVPAAYYGLGWSHLQLNDAQGAQQALDQLLQKFPDNSLVPRTRYARGVALFRQQQFEPARADLDLFTQALPDDESAAEAACLSAACSMALKNFDQAIAAWNQVLERYPDYPRNDRVYYDLAWAFRALQQPQQALQRFEILANKFPQSALAVEALYHLAEEDYGSGLFEKAVQRYAAILAHPERKANMELGEKAAYKRAWCDFQTKQYDQALTHFQQQVTDFPAGTLLQEAKFMVGECHFNLQAYEDALKSFRELDAEKIRAEIRPTFYLHAGQSAGQLSQWEDSLQWLQVVPSKFSNSENIVQANYEIGWAYHQTGRRDDAIGAYRKVAEVARNAVGARARFMIGELLFEQKQYAKAIQEFQRVMFGYGGTNAPEPLHVWQAKAGFESGQCAVALVRLSRDPVSQQRWLAEATKAFRYVLQSHPQSEEAERAKQRLTQLRAP